MPRKNPIAAAIPAAPPLAAQPPNPFDYLAQVLVSYVAHIDQPAQQPTLDAGRNALVAIDGTLKARDKRIAELEAELAELKAKPRAKR